MALNTVEPDASRALRKALGVFPTGVTIVTATGERDVGLTVNSFNSVSLDPPLVLWSLARRSSSRPVFEQADYFAVHILSADQESLASQFARGGADKFAGVAVERGLGDVPLIEGCAARFECRVAHAYQGGDHIIFVGEVKHFETSEKPSLAFHQGKYALSLRKAADPKAVATDAASGAHYVDRNGLNMMLGVAYQHLRRILDQQLASFNLSEFDYWVMHMVGSEEGRTIEQLSGLLQSSGFRLDREQAESLAVRGYIRLDSGNGAARAFLTETGRRVLIELAQATKSVDSAAEDTLDFVEAQLMRQLLRRFINSMRTCGDA